MSINEGVLNRLKRDFHQNRDDETLLFADEVEENLFWDWFQNEAEQYTISNTHNSTLIGAHNIGSRCFGNSQTICYNEDLGYCEGFVLVNDEFVFHGYNLNTDGLVEDYTVLSNPEAFGTVTCDYYGVKIDKDFICDNNLEVLVDGAMNIPHLLLKYYRQRINVEHI